MHKTDSLWPGSQWPSKRDGQTRTKRGAPGAPGIGNNALGEDKRQPGQESGAPGADDGGKNHEPGSLRRPGVDEICPEHIVCLW